MSNATLLVELFVEELPPKALAKLSAAFAESIAASLRTQGLVPEGAAVQAHGTPRRLGVSIGTVAARAADRVERQKLVPAKVGLDAAGAATPVLLKKLASMGLDESALPRMVRAMDGKNETLYLDVTVPGATLDAALQLAFDEALAKLPIPKVMTYQLADGWSSVKFVRPAHGILALHGSRVVPVTALGLVSGRTTRGHRFESRRAQLEIPDADSYEALLRTEGGVITSFAARRAEIARQLAEGAPAGLVPIRDEDLLDEVTSLVENPNVLLCSFEAEFLAVPQECLILTMKQNQKYFPLLDAAGKLSNRFLVVSNIRPADASAVVGGNERVVRPRLADARFFFEQDRKKTLEARIPGLARVVYHNKLGTQGERVERVRAIARAIGKALDGEALAASADRAALLAKADLLTDMVGEFPELQGTMGGYYARNDGETEVVAQAIEDHYKPRFAGDALPRNTAGLVVALADKVETLVGLFGIGQVPTGDKDPFALRRHALGVIRMLVERALPLAVPHLVETAFRAFPGVPHRLEQIRELEGVRWFNDSKATNYDAAEVALRALEGPLVVLAGGESKRGRSEGWIEQLQRQSRAVVLFGAAQAEFRGLLEQGGYSGAIKAVEGLAEAVPLARQLARAHDCQAVLLSPACASFDQYRDFEARGDHFRQLVQAL